MILVTVCNDDALDFVFAFKDIFHVRDDDVNPQHIALGEHEAAIDDQQLIVVFKDHHILADLANAAEGDNAQTVLRQW